MKEQGKSKATLAAQLMVRDAEIERLTLVKVAATELRQAVAFYDKAHAAPNGPETGAQKDADIWLMRAARKVVAALNEVDTNA